MVIARSVSNVFIVAAKRTAFGTYGGSLKTASPTMLQVAACQGALAQGNINPELVNSITIGNVLQASATDACYVSRHVGLKCGVPIRVPALTISRLCGSGFQAVVNAAQEINLGEASICLVGGTDSMSCAPYAIRNIRFGTKLGDKMELEDVMWSALTDSYTGLPMAITAENLAEQYSISRQDCDDFALQSQQRWGKAQQEGVFKAEITPFEIKGKKGPVSFEIDEHPKPNSTPEALAKLPAVFKKGGTVTAGNASGICDGAAALVVASKEAVKQHNLTPLARLVSYGIAGGICDGAAALVVASEEAVKQHNLTPLARLVSYGIAGCDPKIMGIGPVPAGEGALKAAGLSVQDMDICEVNEAFAAQYLAVEKGLGLDRDKTNMHGGAIAIGHPLAASGARITGHLVHELQRQNKKYAFGSACIGGGQGIALILEKC